jgi:hypothetical protein
MPFSVHHDGLAVAKGCNNRNPWFIRTFMEVHIVSAFGFDQRSSFDVTYPQWKARVFDRDDRRRSVPDYSRIRSTAPVHRR